MRKDRSRSLPDHEDTILVFHHDRSRTWFCQWLLGMPVSTLAAGENGSTPRKSSAGLRMLEELQTVITDLAEEAKPSVVSIFPVQATGRLRDAGERTPNAPVPALGGVDANGHIITNNHVVGDATRSRSAPFR